MNEDQGYKRMQVKVLYSFNNNSTVFLSRSKTQYSVKVAQIPIASSQYEEEMVTLGAFEIRNCVQQILKASPENFKLQMEDYAVYYKDLTEQPDEPFVSNGVFSELLSSSKTHLIPGRVCQNLSASYLFGQKPDSSSLTLEIRLMLHSIDKSNESSQIHSSSQPSKRATESYPNYMQKKPKYKPTNSVQPVKATRTKSLPIFYNPHNQQIFNIINADKSNAPSKYDSKSVQDRFKLAPFLQAKIIDNPLKRGRNGYESQPQRAMRTRSMMNHTPVAISSPIQEEPISDNSDGTDDTEYRENPREQEGEEDEEDDEDNAGEPSPYTPQQPPYKASDSNSTFQALPDMEDLDGKKTHTIPSSKLDDSHDLICINNNCATSSSITWRYFETGFHRNHYDILKAKKFDKKHYDGMFGPLCNACYLFLRNKGFMRPEGVVKKYLQQQKYKKELRQRDESKDDSNNFVEPNFNLTMQKARSNSSNRLKKPNQVGTSPAMSRFSTPSNTPVTIPQETQRNRQQNPSQYNNKLNTTQNYNKGQNSDFHEFMSRLDGPLTDIDLLSHDPQTVSSPMMATKLNTRVINVSDEEDKENCPPYNNGDVNQGGDGFMEFENMIAKSFSYTSAKSSPIGQHEWINNLFGGPTPKDQMVPTPKDINSAKRKGEVTENELDENRYENVPQMRTFVNDRVKTRSPMGQLDNRKAVVVNMPSSPLVNPQNNADEELEAFLEEHQEDNSNLAQVNSGDGLAKVQNLVQTYDSPNASKASRLDTTNLMISWGASNTRKSNVASTPNTDYFSNDDIKHSNLDSIKIHEDFLNGEL